MYRERENQLKLKLRSEICILCYVTFHLCMFKFGLITDLKYKKIHCNLSKRVQFSFLSFQATQRIEFNSINLVTFLLYIATCIFLFLVLIGKTRTNINRTLTCKEDTKC